MKALTEEFLTDLRVKECAQRFQTGARAAYGGRRKMLSAVSKMQNRPNVDFGFFTPRTDDVFGALDDDPATWTGGVTVPGVNGIHGTVEMYVHLYVWDRGTHRDVQLYAPYAMGDKSSTRAVLRRILQEFPNVTADGSVAGEPDLAEAPIPAVLAKPEPSHVAQGANMTLLGVEFSSGPLAPVHGAIADPTGLTKRPDPAPPATAGSGASPSEGRPNWLPWAIGAGVLALLGGGIAIATSGGSQPSRSAVQTTQSVPGSGTDAPEAAESTDPLDATGTWTGTMYGTATNYEFSLRLKESDGDLTGKMRQVQVSKDSGSPTGLDGTEMVEGSRVGKRITLIGTGFSADTPDGWYLDTIKLRLSSDGQDFTGTYTCAVCSVNPIRGERQ